MSSSEEKFYFYKKIKADNDNANRSSSKLHNLYNKIPETKGCLENINKEGGCGGWCCDTQSPQLFYSEFLNIWNYIKRDFSNDEFIEFLRSAMYNVVYSEIQKGCIFFNKEEKTCFVHNKRPYNCRIYGITPEEEFRCRLEKLRSIDYGDKFGIEIFRDQCDLVSTCNGEIVKQGDIDKWWDVLFEIEKEIGIKESDINDNIESGSYRSPHDHFLLYLMPNNVLTSLSGIKMYAREEEKKEAVDNLIGSIKEFFNK